MRDKKEREGMVSKMEEGEWGGETGRRLKWINKWPGKEGEEMTK